VGGTCGTHGEGRDVYRVLVERPEGKETTGKTGFSWLRIGPVAGFCEHGDEPSGTIKKTGYF
jgi:hypothetical protein